MKMILLSVVILSLAFANGLAQKVITCKGSKQSPSRCDFIGLTIGQDELISIATDPTDLDRNSITFIRISDSSIHSVPSEIFQDFPNLKEFYAYGNNIQEVKADTFLSGKNLELISLDQNALTFLHKDTFKGPANLKTIYLYTNKLSALHPQMFSHLANLDELWLTENVCINKSFKNKPLKATIESELAACEARYATTELQNLQERLERKFELLTELFYNVDERNKENAREIKEIKKMVDKIWDMLTRAKWKSM